MAARLIEESAARRVSPHAWRLEPEEFPGRRVARDGDRLRGDSFRRSHVRYRFPVESSSAEIVLSAAAMEGFVRGGGRALLADATSAGVPRERLGSKRRRIAASGLADAGAGGWQVAAEYLQRRGASRSRCSDSRRDLIVPLRPARWRRSSEKRYDQISIRPGAGDIWIRAATRLCQWKWNFGGRDPRQAQGPVRRFDGPAQRRANCAIGTGRATPARGAHGVSQCPSGESAPALVGTSAEDQADVDRRLIELDGTPDLEIPLRRERDHQESPARRPAPWRRLYAESRCGADCRGIAKPLFRCRWSS